MARKIRDVFEADIERLLLQIRDEPPDPSSAMNRAVAWNITTLHEDGNLRALIHGFLNRLPVYLTGDPGDVAIAIWNDLLGQEVAEAIESVRHETDGNGEPRYLRVGDDQYQKNPAFDEDSWEAKRSSE